jgi:hypothetical protein
MGWPMRVALHIVCLAGLVALGFPVRSQTVADKPLPPTVPLSGTPLDWFRQLLTMSAAERERALAEADKTEAQREVLRSKVLEYEALPSEERERRLHAVQLRLWITKLMPMAPGNRTERLAALPETDRQLVMQRLNEWDKLPAEEQQEFLQNQRTIYSVKPRPGGSPESTNLPSSLAPPQRERLVQELARLRALPPDRRERVFDNFEKFLELPAKEKAKALGSFSDADRKQMAATLEEFQKLPREQRVACIKAFAKLATLTKSERDQFLKNVELWQAMTPADRATWRRLVTRSPPMPPALPPPPLPAVPGRTGAQARSEPSGAAK